MRVSSKRSVTVRPLWSKASKAIEEASEVTVIGYSMPNDDLQARALLCTSFAARRSGYLLIDPDPSIAAKYGGWIAVHCESVVAPFSSETLEVAFRS